MTPQSDSRASAALVRADVLVLMREKRYEEALALLYRARSESPNNSELQKSIDQIKEFLIGAYAKRLGGLDRIALPIPVSAPRSPDIVLLSRYIDGTSTIGDVAQMSPLGQLRTLQVLTGVYPKRASMPGFEATIASPPDAEPDLPSSGLRAPELPTQPTSEAAGAVPGDDTRPPDTARSPSSSATPPAWPSSGAVAVAVTPVPVPVETPEAREYRERFEQGTAAFVQHRYLDAIAAFEACAQLRVGDAAADVMLRRSRRDFESR